MSIINAQYVKFIKGTEEAWQALINKDSNTLYFIYESSNATTGKLYLGEKLISDGTLENSLTIDKVTADLIAAGVADKSILVYNEEKNKWDIQPLETMVASIVSVMTGATIDTDGIGGLVPAPKANQYHMFLRGDGTWEDPAVSISADLSEIQQQLDTLVGTDDGKSVADIIEEHNTLSTWGSF